MMIVGLCALAALLELDTAYVGQFMMMLAAEHGSSVVITADGPDEGEALAALRQLFERKFEEE